jgi:hypothetical protein
VTGKRAGRPKGTRVTLCSCGRRVAGMLNKFVVCSGCGARVKITTRKKKAKALFLHVNNTKPEA